MDAPILWVPGKIASFLNENLHAHKNFSFLGVGNWVFFGEGGGGSADFMFMGARIF